MLNFWRMRSKKLHQFQPKVTIFSDRGPFILKTVNSSDELIEALKLRYQVFHREMLGKTKTTGLDFDDYDLGCDHLVIIDKKDGRIVGTYRMNCSLFSSQFYSSQEFHLRKILETPGVKTELGRACIHQDYRKGLVIALLWRGIAEYMQATQSQILFGCASIKTESPQEAALIYRSFQEQGRIQEQLTCPPTLKYQMPQLDQWVRRHPEPLTDAEKDQVDQLVPPLCRAYLKAGALIAGEPAYDVDFRCIDFLTILPRENLNRALWRKYNLCPDNSQEYRAEASSPNNWSASPTSESSSVQM